MAKWVKGQSGNPKGRPRLGDSLAECIRARWVPAQRAAAIAALAARAAAGEAAAFDILAKRGWPDEAKGELTLVTDPAAPPTIVHKHVDA